MPPSSPDAERSLWPQLGLPTVAGWPAHGHCSLKRIAPGPFWKIGVAVVAHTRRDSNAGLGGLEGPVYTATPHTSISKGHKHPSSQIFAVFERPDPTLLFTYLRRL